MIIFLLYYKDNPKEKEITACKKKLPGGFFIFSDC